MNRLKKIFETRVAAIICFLFAIANRIIFTSLNSLIGTDTKIQLTYTENLLAGKGMGVTKYFTDNPNNPFYDNHLLFPPGFSLSVIPFLKLSDGDEFKAVLAFDILAAILFVIAVWLLGKRSGLSLAFNNIMTLIAGCSQYVFFMSWSSTDVIGLTLVLYGLTKMIDVIYQQGKMGWGKIIGHSLLFCLPYFFRYMYLPVAILLPSLILLLGFIEKNKQLKVAGGRLLGSTIALLFFLFATTLLISGNTIHINDFGRGIFFGQLVHWYPFIPASFINLDFAAQLLVKVTSITYGGALYFFGISNLILLLLLIGFLFRFLNRLPGNPSGSRSLIFIIGGSAISILIVFMLGYLSLTYKELDWGLNKWTYVIDERYFSFIYVFLPLLLFVCIQYYAVLKWRSMRILVFACLLCLGIEVMHGVYYNIKIITSHKDLTTIKDADKGYRNFSFVVAEMKRKYPGREIFVSSPDQYYLHAASQLGCKAIFDYEKLGQVDLRPGSKSILLLPVHQQEAIIINDYIEIKKPQLFLEIAGTYFYIEEINP